MNKYYVYVHYRTTDGTPFYVGKGHGNRAWVQNKRNPYWKSTKNKHGISVEIIFDNLTEEESFQCEIDTILEFKYFGHKLTNMTNGGEGVSGLVVTEKTRRMISSKLKGRKFTEATLMKLKNANKGRKVPEDQRAKMRLAKLGRYAGNSNPYADKTVYLFVRIKDNFEFSGTRSDLCNSFDVKRDQIKKLFYKLSPRKSAGGWKLKECQNDQSNS